MENYIKYPEWIKYCEGLCANNKNFEMVDILIFNEENFNEEKIKKKYENKKLILINGDVDFPPPKTPYLNDNELKREYTERICYKVMDILEKYNIKIICYSSTVIHKNVKMIPIGISWQQPINLGINNKKTILCYANYGIPCKSWHGKIRKKLTEVINNIIYIYKENIVIDTKERKTCDKYDNYFSKLMSSKFAVCPRGCGADCYRMYDALLCDCIPIILKTSNYYLNLSLFPVLVLDKWEDLNNYNEKKLNKLYDKMMNNNYKKYLNIDYWKKEINDF